MALSLKRLYSAETYRRINNQDRCSIGYAVLSLCRSSKRNALASLRYLDIV